MSVRKRRSGNTLTDDEVVQHYARMSEELAPVVDRAAAGLIPVDIADAPFQVLGYNQGSYYYLPRGSRQVVDLRSEQHTKLKLMSLAPLQYWEAAYASNTGVKWDLAANALMRQAELVGVYDTSRIRGRGAWWDKDHAVLHLGDQLVANGQAIPVASAPPGRYIYEASPRMAIESADPLPVDDANRVMQLTELINWERPISARLLAGWCVIAPICGAVTWRPHIWLTGPAGSGKTWIIDGIVRRLLGDVGLSVQSETTEAGLRQTLGHDARPIVFDEIEGEDERARMRVSNILALARQASSETGATIIKGSSSGVAKTYRIRSAFAFSSIGVGLSQHADNTRVSVLSVERDDTPGRPARFAASAALAASLTDDYVQRFIARSIHMVPTIRANAATFAAAGAEVIGSQRLGDQIGALLAGAYSLYQDDAITPDVARAWVAEQDWSEQRSVHDSTDESRCLQRILEHVVRVQAEHFMGDRSVSELILIGVGKKEDKIKPREAQEHLARIGIRAVDADAHFTVASSHGALERILSGTAWVKGWPRLLRRLAGATATAAAVRFGSIRARGVEIPLEAAGIL